MMELMIAVLLTTSVLGLYVFCNRLLKKNFSKKEKGVSSSLEAEEPFDSFEASMEQHLTETVWMMDPMVILTWKM